MRRSLLGRPARRLIALLLLGLVALAVDPGPARAQVPGAAPAGQAAPAPAAPEIDRRQLEALLKTLEDPAARERLAEQVRALMAVRQQAEPEESVQPGALGAQTLRFISQQLGALGEQAGAVATAFRDLPLAAEWFERQLTDDYRRDRWGDLILQLTAAIFAGFLASGAVSWLLRRPRKALEGRQTPGWAPRIPFMLARTVLELLPLGAFAVAGYGLLSVSEPPRLIRVVALTVINATIGIQFVMVLARAALAPGVPNLRLLPMGGETAHYVYIWVRRLAYTAVCGYLASNAAYVLGLPLGAYMALLKLVGLVITAMLVVLILQNRAHVAAWLRGAPLSGGSPEAEAGEIARGQRSAALRTLRRRLADVWHVLAILYVVVTYGIWALNVEGGFEFMLRATVVTVVALFLARALVTLLDGLVRRAFAISPEIRRAYPGMELRANRYLPVLQKVLKGAVWLFAGLAILNAWGVDSFAWLESPLGQRVSGSVLTIGLVLVFAIASWEIVSSAIERYLIGNIHNGTKVERSARVRTLLPLLRNAFLVLLITVVSLITLSELGLDIAPLLAGAGVIGLAIGFGSQTLVKDVITGLFILFEDTISVGDVVDVGGGHSGLVEALSIRSLRLRDTAGAVHSIPFSQVATVTNLTKDFSFYVFDIGVSYTEDSDRVIDVVRALGAELQKDPEYMPLILEPIEIMGLDSFRDSAIIIKARFKTRPIMQWKVGREFNRRLKKRFDELGIEIPFPQRTVHVRGDATEIPRERLLAAAAKAGAGK
jgi:small conductance mechanosensitive channel